MDNPNLNPSTPDNSAPKPQESEAKFPSYESMQKNHKKSPHFLVAIIVIIVAGMGLLWYYLGIDFEYMPTQLRIPSQNNRPSPNELNEVNSIDVGDLNSEFQSIDTDLNSL